MTPTEHDELHDAELSRLYRELPTETPSSALDERLRAEARRAVVAGPRRWLKPWPMTGLATAATVILAVAMVRYWQAEQPAELARAVSVTPAAEAPAAEAESPAKEVGPITRPMVSAPAEAPKEVVVPVEADKRALDEKRSQVVVPVAAPSSEPAPAGAMVSSGVAKKDESPAAPGQMSVAVAVAVAEEAKTAEMSAKPSPAAPAPAPALLGRMAPRLSALQRAEEPPAAKAEAEADAMVERGAGEHAPAASKPAEAERREQGAAPAVQAKSLAMASYPRYEELVATGRYVEALARLEPTRLTSLQQRAEYDLLAALVHGLEGEPPQCSAELQPSRQAAVQLCLILQRLRAGQPVSDAQVTAVERRLRQVAPTRLYVLPAVRELVRRHRP